MAIRRVFTARPEQQSEKVVIVGLDFGTSYTKVFFNQSGEIKQPIQFQINGKQTYFHPTELFYNSLKNEVFFNNHENCEKLKYFKYSMINDELITSSNLRNKNASLDIKPEFLCSVYFLAYLIKEVKQQISTIIQSTEIKYSINMGCPIVNFSNVNKGIYDQALSVAYQLSENIHDDGMAIEDIYSFVKSNLNNVYQNLQTVPELYAEALWFIEQPSTGEGIYSILDIGGGTVDFANIFVKRTNEGEKKTTIYSQNVIPFGIEVLLQHMYPNEYITKRKECLDELKECIVCMPWGWTQEDLKDRKLKKAIEFNNAFTDEILDLRDKDRALMERQKTTRRQIPYYSFGGGADFSWYHSIINQTASAYIKSGIPHLHREKVVINTLPNHRLIIAEQLTRSNFPEIDNFPWHFEREEPLITNPNSPDLEDIQKERYGG